MIKGYYDNEPFIYQNGCWAGPGAIDTQADLLVAAGEQIDVPTMQLVTLDPANEASVLAWMRTQPEIEIFRTNVILAPPVPEGAIP